MLIKVLRPVINPRLLSSRRVTLLPHMAGSTIDADKVSCGDLSYARIDSLTSWQKFEEIAMKNIEIYFLGDGKLLTAVNNVLS